MVALNEERNVPNEQGDDFSLYSAESGSNIHRGAFLGWSGATRFVCPFQDGDVLAGVARESLDSRTLALGDEQPLEVLVSGRVEIPVAGVVDDTDHHAQVFITTDQDASLTDSGTDTVFGAIKKVTGAGIAIVKFAAV